MPYSCAVAKAEADRLFDDVLRRKDEADGTRNALAVLHRFRFLFNLPAVIDRNIQKGEYDLVINDYARANNLYRNSEVQVFLDAFFPQTIIDDDFSYRFSNACYKKLKERSLTCEKYLPKSSSGTLHRLTNRKK